MKQRAFEEPEVEDGAAPAPARTEPAPHARTAVALVLASWALPLTMLVSLFRYAEDEPTTQSVHRVLTFVTLGLLLAGLGLAIRAIDRARKDRRVRRRLAIAALMLSLLTPVVWTSELMLAWRVFLVREGLDAAAEGDASSPHAE